MLFTPLAGDQVRQLINCEQTYAAFRAALSERDLRFRGSMAWKRVRGREYLYRKSGGNWKSLGPRNAETEAIRARFRTGRSAIKEKIAALDAALREMAPVNRAMRLGRVPRVAARLLRKLTRDRLLGGAIRVVGTHALYAYERMAGGHFHSSQVSTHDIDLLYDARRGMHVVASDVREEGLIGILRNIDKSFETIAPGGFRAVNAAGFMVDLISPMPRGPSERAAPRRIGTGGEDMIAAEMEGLAWLQNCPQVEQTVVDERGYPLQLHVPDPRAFALHKLWVSKRPDRDVLKARRDEAQARAVAGLVKRYLPQLRFDDPALGAIPEALRAEVPELLSAAELADSDEGW